MTFQKCEYRSQCKHYDKDSICCTFLNKICRYQVHYKKMEQISLERVEFRVTGIEGCLNDAKLFELSQAEQDKGFKEDYY